MIDEHRAAQRSVMLPSREVLPAHLLHPLIQGVQDREPAPGLSLVNAVDVLEIIFIAQILDGAPHVGDEDGLMLEADPRLELSARFDEQSQGGKADGVLESILHRAGRRQLAFGGCPLLRKFHST